MATKKISELEAINSAEESDVLVIVDVSEGKTNKITKGNLLAGAGHTIEIQLNSQTYQLEFKLKNTEGTVLSTQVLDLPSENALTNITYSDGELTLTKQSGETSTVDISGLISDLVEEVNDLKEQLKDRQNNELKGTVSGTEIDLSDSADSRVSEIGLSGNSEQETTEGYNILDFNVSQNSKVTVNDDGTITINGTGGFNLNYTQVELEAGQTYKQKIKIVSGNITGANKDYSFMSFNGSTWISDGSYVTYTPSENVSKTTMWLNANATFDNLRVKIWAYKGTDNNKDYEPYTNGASPNPDYEQPIKSAGDNVNLSLLEFISTVSGGYITKNQSFIANVEAGKTYTLSMYCKENLSLTNKIMVRNYYPNTASTIYEELSDFKFNSGNRITTTITPNYNGDLSINANFSSFGSDIDEILYDIKLESGSTSSSWSPYGMGCITEKIVNKNLFDKDKATVMGGQNIILEHVEGLKVGEKYTAYANGHGWLMAREFDANGNIINTFGKNLESNILTTFSLSSKENYINVWFYSGSSAVDINNYDFTNVMIVEGEYTSVSQLPSYEPHQEQTYTIPTQQPMRSIGTTRDPFFKNTTDSPYYNSSLVENKWYEMHRIRRYIIKGTETIEFANTINQINYFQFQYILSNKLNKTDSPMLCNYFKKITIYQTDAGTKEGIASGLYPHYPIKIGTKLFSSVSEFRAWLTELYENGTPMYVDYELATPTYLLCTDEQVQALEAYCKARTYKNITHLYSEDEVPGYVDMTYYKDLETYLGNEIGNVKQAIVALGGVV